MCNLPSEEAPLRPTSASTSTSFAYLERP
jgi:hypothetical protein